MQALKQTTRAEEFSPSSLEKTADQMVETGGVFGAIRKSQNSFAQRHESERLAKTRMAALKRFSPLILGVIHRPGVDGAPADKANALRAMMDTSHTLAKDVVEYITGGTNASEFIVDQALSAVSEIVATEWAFNGGTDVRPQVFAVLDHIGELGDVADDIGDTHWKPGGNNTNEEIRAGLFMSLMKSSEPIYSLLQDFGVTEPRVFEQLQDLLVNDAADYLAGISHQLASSMRLMMVQNFLSISARILKVSLSGGLSAPTGDLKQKITSSVSDWRVGVSMLRDTVDLRTAQLMSQIEKKNSPNNEGMSP